MPAPGRRRLAAELEGRGQGGLEGADRLSTAGRSPASWPCSTMLAGCREMQDADLFLGLAGIAGVFVGFGALIAVRSGGASDAFEVTYTRFVVWIGMLTIVAALAPVTLGPYGLGEHEVWALSCVIVVGRLPRDGRRQHADARASGRSTPRCPGGAGWSTYGISALVGVPVARRDGRHRARACDRSWRRRCTARGRAGPARRGRNAAGARLLAAAPGGCVSDAPGPDRSGALRTPAGRSRGGRRTSADGPHARSRRGGAGAGPRSARRARRWRDMKEPTCFDGGDRRRVRGLRGAHRRAERRRERAIEVRVR